MALGNLSLLVVVGLVAGLCCAQNTTTTTTTTPPPPATLPPATDGLGCESAIQLYLEDVQTASTVGTDSQIAPGSCIQDYYLYEGYTRWYYFIMPDNGDVLLNVESYTTGALPYIYIMEDSNLDCSLTCPRLYFPGTSASQGNQMMYRGTGTAYLLEVVTEVPEEVTFALEVQPYPDVGGGVDGDDDVTAGNSLTYASDGLSSGAVVGIVFGSMFLFVCLTLVIIFGALACCQLSQAKSYSKSSNHGGERGVVSANTSMPVTVTPHAAVTPVQAVALDSLPPAADVMEAKPVAMDGDAPPSYDEVRKAQGA